MGCGISVIKYVLFLVNIICALAGIALIVLGSLAFSNIKSLENNENNGFKILCIAIIVLGSVISIISFFGCCGAIRESHCMTMTYAVILLILLILEIAIIAFVFVTNTKGGELFDALWDERSKPGGQDTIDAIQRALKCCGKNGPADYLLPTPAYCCPKDDTLTCTISPNKFTEGCHEAVHDFIKKNATILGYASIAVAVVEAIGFIFACTLANHVRNYRRRSAY